MVGLRYRDSLPPVVVDEFENLIAKLKGFLSVEHNEDGTLRERTRTFDFVPVGAINPYAGATAPQGWRLCDGSQVSRVSFATLFSVCGTTYGSGDGSTTFHLPDLRQKFPLGKAASGTGATLGSTGGAIDHVHTGPSHTHSITGVSDHDHDGSTGDAGAHDHDFSGTTGLKDAINTCQDGVTKMMADVDHQHPFEGTTDGVGNHAHTIAADGAHDHGGATGASGTGDTGTANPPFLAVNYIIYTGVANA